MTLLDSALAYAAHGWAVFPCRPRGKMPITAHGVKDATTDPDKIEAWWTDTPDANIGIATGAPSGIWVVDIDGEAGLQSLRRLATIGHELPMTVSSGTGHGTHLFYAIPPGATIRNRAGVWAGVDIRGDGGYVIAPPSLHPSGKTYRWIWPEHEAAR